MKPNEYIEHDATGLAELIRDKQVSVDEVHQAARTAIETVNPTLNAVVEGPWDRALDCNEQGLFAGGSLCTQGFCRTRGRSTDQVRKSAGGRRCNLSSRHRTDDTIPGGRIGCCGGDHHTGIRVQRKHRTCCSRLDAQSVGHRTQCRRIEWRISGIGRSASPSHRSRYRRWRVDPNSGVRQRVGGSETEPGGVYQWALTRANHSQAGGPSWGSPDRCVTAQRYSMP